jgi:hypothetical protein
MRMIERPWCALALLLVALAAVLGLSASLRAQTPGEVLRGLLGQTPKPPASDEELNTLIEHRIGGYLLLVPLRMMPQGYWTSPPPQGPFDSLALHFSMPGMAPPDSVQTIMCRARCPDKVEVFVRANSVPTEQQWQNFLDLLPSRLMTHRFGLEFRKWGSSDDPKQGVLIYFGGRMADGSFVMGQCSSAAMAATAVRTLDDIIAREMAQCHVRSDPLPGLQVVTMFGAHHLPEWEKMHGAVLALVNGFIAKQ